MLIYSKKAPKMLREMAFHGDMKAIQMLYEANSGGVMHTRFGEVQFDRDPDLHSAVADVLVEFGDSDVQREVSAQLASGRIKSASMTSTRSAQIRDRLRKSVVGLANGKSTHTALRGNHHLPACN
jgi:hypothetical protein